MIKNTLAVLAFSAGLLVVAHLAKKHIEEKRQSW